MNKFLLPLFVVFCCTLFAESWWQKLFRSSPQTPVNIQSLTCVPTPPDALSPGQIGTCTITLTAKAPHGGMAFRITATSDQLNIPATNVTVAQGQRTTTFPISGK